MTWPVKEDAKEIDLNCLRYILADEEARIKMFVNNCENPTPWKFQWYSHAKAFIRTIQAEIERRVKNITY